MGPPWCFFGKDFFLASHNNKNKYFLYLSDSTTFCSNNMFMISTLQHSNTDIYFTPLSLENKLCVFHTGSILIDWPQIA